MAPGLIIGNNGQVASYGITVKVPAIPLWLPEQGQQILRTLVRNTVRFALLEVSGRISEAAGEFSDTGALAQSFGSDPATSTGGIELTTGASGGPDDVVGRVFSTLPYAIVMDQGRRAGFPISRAGIDAIGLWAVRKLGLSREQADRAKWAIAHKIIARGIQGRHYFERGVSAAAPRVEGMFSALGTQLAQALVGASRGQTGGAMGGVA